MFLSLINLIVSNFPILFGSYSNNAFPDPLSQEDEEKTIEKMLQGDKEARNKLIEHNLRLVAHIVKKFESSTNDVDDLIGIGTVGLIKGIDSFSPDKKVKLTTYIAKCAENEILMYFRADKKNSKNVSLFDGISYDKEGNETGRYSLTSAKEEGVLRVLPEEETVRPEGLAFVRLRYTDEDGIWRPVEKHTLKVTVENGTLLGLGSANSYVRGNYTADTADTYYGEALAVVRAGRTGEVTVQAADENGSAHAVIPVV